MSLQQASTRFKPLHFSRETLHIWMLSTALILTYTAPSFIYSALFVFVVFAYLLPTSGAIDPNTSRVLKPIYWLALLGLIYSFNNAPSDITRDVWHIVKAVSCMMVGYLLARIVHRTPRLLKHFLMVSLLLSLLYIAPYLTGFRQIGLDRTADDAQIPLVTAIALPLLLISRNGLVQFLSPHFRLIAVFIILLAYGLSLSRTAIGCAVIMMLAAVGIFDNAKRLLLYASILGALAFSAVQLLPSIEPSDITFASKIRNSLAEIAFTDDSDPTQMLINWRGFEAYRAFIDFINSTPLQQLVGRGFGATVDLGIPVQMSEEMNFQFIPVLHNGYLHILAKYGVLGVLFYLIFLRRISSQPFEILETDDKTNIYRILIGLSITLTYTTLVISGIFNKDNLDSILIMLGVFLGITANQQELRNEPSSGAETSHK